ncbi:MAG: HAMP domain-containing protein [Sulfitobacter sp.]|nr:HAMP domain-containing protein [Sulfitobacter sp.]
MPDAPAADEKTETATEPRGRVPLLKSIFLKCTLMVALCVFAVVAVIEYRNHAQLVEKVERNVAMRATEVTELLAHQLAGSAKFGNVDAIAEIVAGVRKTAGQDLENALVLDGASAVLFATKGADVSALMPFAEQSMASQQIVRSETGATVAMPMTFGAGDSLAGSVVLEWTAEYELAALAAEQSKTLLIGLGVFAIALAAVALFLRALMSRPLNDLAEAMEEVARENFDVDISHTARSDEVGLMANRLDAFRRDLSRAKEAQHEMAFKGAAFEGSAAALMTVDQEFLVQFANPACFALISDLMPELGEVWPGLRPDSLLGADLRDMKMLRNDLPSGPGGAGHTTTDIMFTLADRNLRIKVNPAGGAGGTQVGFVLEWSDRTKAYRNAALIDAIDTSQLRIEFNRNGTVFDTNDNFLSLIHGTEEDTRTCSLTGMFANNLPGDTDGSQFARQVYALELKSGRFSANSGHADQTFVLEGSFAVVNDEKGRADRVIFLGRDVSVQDAEMHEAEAVRKRNAEEQAHVVTLLGQALNTLAEGDLDCDINEPMPPAYEKLRNDFNDTVGSLRGTISAVIHNSDSIRNETSEITSAADDLSRRTEKQAATLEETAAALDELTVSVKSAAEGADDASKMSADAQRNAEQGGDVARQAVEAMDGIKNSSQEISKITSVIDDIAFQTNLLALNAGVEAARAGEAGRGFAVVATEVRALAQRSSDAAREINTLITSSGDQVNQGVHLVDRTGTALASIVTSVSEISKRVSNIAASAREQSSGLAEINSAMNELDHVTQQNAAMFEETTAASHALTSEADALVSAVTRFKLGGMQLDTAQHTRPSGQTQPRPTAARFTQGNAALQMESVPEADGWEDF